MTPDRPKQAGRVVPLGVDREPESPPQVSRPGRLHGMAIAGMATSALVGVVSMFLFVMVRWPDETGRYVIAVFFLSAIGFLACASTAVFTAARDTYAAAPREPESDEASE